MSVAHQHDDIEFNLSPGTVRYLIDGSVTTLHAGGLAAFWAARPHQLIGDDLPERLFWLTVPLELLLTWSIPENLVTSLLRGEVLQLADGPLSPPLEQRFSQWSADLSGESPWAQATVHLEVEAFLRRVQRTSVGEESPASPDRGLRLAGEMARYISANSTRALTVPEVAAAVHLHPGYAMALFKRTVGTTVVSYLTQCRVATAQRLLITTHDPIADIGFASGFSSVSQFYDRFTRACGTSPAAYRRQNVGASAGA